MPMEDIYWRKIHVFWFIDDVIIRRRRHDGRPLMLRGKYKHPRKSSRRSYFKRVIHRMRLFNLGARAVIRRITVDGRSIHGASTERPGTAIFSIFSPQEMPLPAPERFRQSGVAL